MQGPLVGGYESEEELRRELIGKTITAVTFGHEDDDEADLMWIWMGDFGLCIFPTTRGKTIHLYIDTHVSSS